VGLLNNLASLYIMQGLYGKAEPVCIEAVAFSRKALGPEHPKTLASLNNLATLYYSQGLYGKAEPLYVQAIAMAEKAIGLDHPDTAISLNSLATLYSKQGFYSKAEPLFNQALGIRIKALGSGHPDTARSLNNLAVLYSRQGIESKAELLHTQALIIRQNALGLFHPDTANSLNNLASLYSDQGLYTKAEPFYTQALAIIQKGLGPDHPNTARSLNNLASLYLRQGLYSKAELLFNQALAIRIKTLGLDHPDTAESLSSLAILYSDQGLYAKAVSLYTQALAIRQKTLGPDHSDTVTSQTSLAILYSQQGSLTKSALFVRRSLTTEAILLQREAPYLVQSDRAVFLQSFGLANEVVYSFATQNNSHANLALYSRLNRQGLLEQIEKRQAQLAALPGAQQEVAQELRELAQKLSSITINSEQRTVFKARQEELERQLYRLLPELKPRLVQVDQVAAALPAASALVEFQRYQPFDGRKPKEQRWGEARYLALTLKPDRSIATADLGPAAPIDRQIQQALEASEQNQKDANQRWAEVSRSILNPLATAISGARVLFLSPDGELNRVPFAAIPAPGTSQELSETVQLRLLTTGRDLLDLQQPSATPKAAPLVVAHPRFDAPGRPAGAPVRGASGQQRSADLKNPSWSPLPATAREGQAIASLTKGRLLLQEQATAAAVQQLPGPKILHIASHSFFLADQPQKPVLKASASLIRSAASPFGLPAAEGENPLLRSGIALAGANAPAASATDDGYLMALEIVQLDWKGTELVVVSGCESGKGDIQAGEGVYGLRRAIAVAGARSSLLSLWKVDDAATADFMARYYTRLKVEEGRADALAAVQAEFRNGTAGNGQWKEPYYWAAWQLVGDWRPIPGL
jgi:CHAT domain-containing protein/Tfp pilus assembly protein PilF